MYYKQEICHRTAVAVASCLSITDIARVFRAPTKCLTPDSLANLPAKIDIFATRGNEYTFQFMAKGGKLGQQNIPIPKDEGPLERESTVLCMFHFTDCPTARYQSHQAHMTLTGMAWFSMPSNIII